MLNIINSPDKLWQVCTKLSKDNKVIESELFDNSNNHFVLAYGPVAQRNQYQALLYSAHNKFNVSILPIHKLDLCGEIPWPGRVVCHFHWLHDKTKNAQTEEEADKAVPYWENLIHRIKENGHKIVWTVHNVMPHGTIWEDQDKRIHQMMADAADALHVMTSDSAKLTKKYYTLDENKMFFLPHPTYEGAQPDNVTQDEARSQLFIAKDKFVFLSFGAIMEYKGYDRLISIYDCIRVEMPLKTQLIIAGLPSDKELVEKIRCWGEGKHDVILDMTPIPNDRLQVYFRAADLMICPYYRTMNSGVAMMAITFDLPVLGPNQGSFLDLEKSGYGFTFDNSDNTSLFNMILNLVDSRPIFTEELMKSKQTLAPFSVSKLFFNNIQRVVS